jgi:hypothetical protein
MYTLNYALLGYYTTSGDSLLPTFLEKPIDKLSQNVGKKLLLLAA